jgi:hypothetical protein
MLVIGGIASGRVSLLVRVSRYVVECDSVSHLGIDGQPLSGC